MENIIKIANDILKRNSLPEELWNLVKPIKLQVDILCTVEDMRAVRSFIEKNKLELLSNKHTERFNKTINLLKAKIIAEYTEQKGVITKVKSEINMLTDICYILIWGIVSDYQLLPNSFNKEIDNFRKAYRELDFKFK